jgi:hypothetical protein
MKLTPVPKDLRKDVRDALRAARDLMNNNGEHWMKGDYKARIMVPTGKTDWDDRPILQRLEGAFQWCAVGGIQEVAKVHAVEEYALIVLVERGLPPAQVKKYVSGCARSLRIAIEEWNYHQTYFPRDEILKPTDLSPGDRAGIAHDVITGWNDMKKTTWEDVRTAFTKAAASLR